MFEEFKPILENGERYVVVEGGKPEYVLMRFKDYVGLLSGKRGRPIGASLVHDHLGLFDRANAELAETRRDATIPHFEAELAGDPIPPPVDPSAVRLEDLPL